MADGTPMNAEEFLADDPMNADAAAAAEAAESAAATAQSEADGDAAETFAKEAAAQEAAAQEAAAQEATAQEATGQEAAAQEAAAQEAAAQEAEAIHAADDVVKEAPAAPKTPLEICSAILQALLKRKDAGWFRAPVPPGTDGYSDVVSLPMDYGTIEGKLSAGSYEDAAAFAADVRLVAANAIAYSPDATNECHLAARHHLAAFEKSFTKAHLATDGGVAASAAEAAAKAADEVKAPSRKRRSDAAELEELPYWAPPKPRLTPPKPKPPPEPVAPVVQPVPESECAAEADPMMSL